MAISDRGLEQEVAIVARDAGATLVGVAAVPADAPASFGAYPRAVVAAAALSRGILEECRREPTKVYAYHYRAVNVLLDGIATRVAAYLEQRRYKTYAVPASQLIDWDRLMGTVSHVELAVRAGLGYRGRHNLLVTPSHGANVRLVSVFTDAPLPVGDETAGGCGVCRACAEACPAGAIGDAAAAWDRARCIEVLKDFKKRITNQHICGVCVRACPGRGPSVNGV